MYSPLTISAFFTCPVRRKDSATAIPVNIPAHALLMSNDIAFTSPHMRLNRAAVLGSYVNRCGASHRATLQEITRSMASAEKADRSKQSIAAVRARSMEYSPSPDTLRLRIPVNLSSGIGISTRHPARISSVETTSVGNAVPRLSITTFPGEVLMFMHPVLQSRKFSERCHRPSGWVVLRQDHARDRRCA
ncbi:Uncharacterised protein [Mycobacteroides abscessus subsp. massiliense]|nr:Uncharacterised protein [Mycobacteroides abscessus subsp. massiliense]